MSVILAYIFDSLKDTDNETASQIPQQQGWGRIATSHNSLPSEMNDHSIMDVILLGNGHK